MTTATAPRTPTVSAGTSGVSFGGLIRSEWIKLFSLRSTWWTLGATVVAMVGIGMIAASAVSGAGEFGPTFGGAEVATFGYYFAQIPVAVLGAIVISGEFSSGMIRTTMTAAPRRTPAVLAKVVVLGVVVFVVGLGGSLATWAVTTPLIAEVDAQASLGDPETWRILIGAGLYLAGIALVSFGLGLIVRSTAGSVATVLGIVLLVPILVGILGGFVEWVGDVAPFTPSYAGAELMQPAGDSLMPTETFGTLSLGPVVGGLLFAGYVFAFVAIGTVLTKRRDV